MVDVKKVEKTAESGGIQNVGPDDATVKDTAVNQAAATVPGSEAAAAEAMPSDAAVAKYLENQPVTKSFRDTVREREEAVARGEEPSNEAYPTPPRNVKPSKRTQAEMDRGSQAQSDAAHQQPGSALPSDVASRQAKEHNRNVEAEKQVERILGDEAPAELKADPSTAKKK